MPPENQQPKKSSFNAGSLRFWGMAFQLTISVALLGLLGGWLDQWLQLHFPAFTLAGIILGLSAGIANLLRQLNKKK